MRRRVKVVPRLDYAVFVGCGNHIVDEIVVHRVRHKADALEVANEILLAEYGDDWHVKDAIPFKGKAP